jgi:hypothetical protein
MPSLREMQQAFGHALASGDFGTIAPHVVANGLDPAARLRLYRNNHRETSLASLRSTYPVIERLVGPEYFRQAAFDYLAEHPSRSGSLDFLGQEWPSFLASRFEGGQHSYLADVAQLEWACHEVLMAGDHAPLDLEKLRRIPEHRYPALVFSLHPALRLVKSRYPVLRIWRVNQPESDASERIDLDQPERVLLTRAGSRVELRLLDAPDFEFLAGVQRGESFECCVASASEQGEFDAATVLQRLVAAGLIVDVELDL